jgi:hypothetical protein
MYGSGIESLLRARSAKHRKQLEDLQRIKDRFLQVRFRARARIVRS